MVISTPCWRTNFPPQGCTPGCVGSFWQSWSPRPPTKRLKTLFAHHQYTDADAEKTEPGAGALIGSLVRILSAIFIAIGRFEAIALLYTAKTIAWFKKIEEHPRFKEYYLIGTLYSILYLLVA